MIKFPSRGEVITIRAEADSAVAALEVQPFTRFQVSVIFEEWVDPRVARIMKMMKYEPSEGSKLPDFRGQTTRKGLGYDSDIDEPKVRKKSLKLSDYFVKASCYQGEPEPVEVNGIKVEIEIEPGILMIKQKINAIKMNIYKLQQ